jgi:acyl dehydratase/NADP-dependent 3-hydroxy acid dehydrogenase YdfG
VPELTKFDTVGTFLFSTARQSDFAVLSGDSNPMHMSAVAARRTQSGRPVVHGIHSVLRVLDALRAAIPDLPMPAKLIVRFPAPVYIGDSIQVHVVEKTERLIRAQARVDGAATVELRALFARESMASIRGNWGPVENIVDCKELSLAEMKGRVGRVAVAATADTIAAEYPNASAWIGVERVAALMALSRLVGMECPGLHSLFSGFSVEFTAPSSLLLAYRVANLDDHFRLLNIEVEGLGIKGSVEAFARHPAVTQRSIGELSEMVRSHDFTGQNVLIVGGSRGLGETTAKLIASGGGHPIITYAVGKEDADRVAAEIRGFGKQCEVLQYDSLANAADQLAGVGLSISQMYYFSTGQIFARRTKAFDNDVFEEFLSFYVRGFYDLCVALRARGAEKLSVFYPSSVAVEERPKNMTEYAMAKSAGEALCADLNRSWPAFHITVSRLPRLLTDQTSTVVPVETADTAATMLPIIRTVQGFASN